MASAKKSSAHLHGCPDCGATFLCGCRQPGTDPRCNECISGIRNSLIAWGRLPRRHCVEDTREASKDQVKIYSLAGTQPWFMCHECKRAFNHQPKEALA